ncbi:hypothetical protein [Pararhizobium sp. DWP1-1-3]|uniref:hypothetical protein n=1 Tax=Pararhizobium sp. DWP1-1-3 TaxID=2804652 RepID=UPI003CEDAE0F
MGGKQPTGSDIRLWTARVKAEQEKGTPVEDIHAVLTQMIEAWLAVQYGSSAGSTIKSNDGKLI